MLFCAVTRKRKYKFKVEEEKMKRFFAMCMAMVLAFGMVGCNETVTPPSYASDEKFEIGMWVGISDNLVIYDENGQKVSSRPLTDDEFLEKYQEIADAGFTVAFPGYDVMNDGSASYNMKALRAAHEVGIRHILGDGTLRSYVMQAKTLYDSVAKTEEELVQGVKDIIEPYTTSEYADALYGFMIQDEPDASKFDAIAFGEKIFKQAAPDLMFYVNLFPVIAGGAQLSGSDEPIKYDSYLTQYFAKVKTDYVSYDHYPLYGDGVTTSIEASFLYNMDLMRAKIDEEGEDRALWTFLQSIQYGGKNRALASKADATFQAYSFLAYGGDCIQWFCYACPPQNDGATYFGNNALVDRNYEKTATYGYVQSANLDIQAMMPYYKNFDWKGIMISSVYDDTDNFGYLESSKFLLNSTRTVTKIESSEDAFSGVFEDKDGNEGYLVVNFTDPALDRSNQITLSVADGYTHAIVVKNGESAVEKIKNGKLSFTMAAGEGYFVIPFANR